MRKFNSAIRALSAAFCLFLVVPPQLGCAEPRSRSVISTYDEKMQQTSEIALTIAVSGISCTSTRFAEDIRNVLGDLRPDGLRALPVLGVGGLQTLRDVLFLKNIDMGVVDEDTLRLLKRRDPSLYANIEQQVQYIAKLYDSEFQIIARNEIKTFADLRDRRVNFDVRDSQTEVTADLVFNTLKVDTVRSYYDNDIAIKKVIEGDIAAMIVLTGAPEAIFAKLKKEDGVHFLSLDGQTLPSPNIEPILRDYVPAELTHEQYPDLIPEGQSVSTFATRTLLVAYAWPEGSERFKKLAKFVNEFFGRIEQFHDDARHPKWKEINIAANMPGWTRFKPAAVWLAEHQLRIPTAEGGVDLKTAFHQFVEQHAAARGSKPIPLSDQESLYTRFQQFLQSQSNAANRSR
jgi:uncharacterized protein